MDLDLKELGLTFIVGAFTILGLEAILYHFFKLNITGFFQRPRKQLWERERSVTEVDEEIEVEEREEPDPKIQPMRAAVFIGISFAVGILAEDLSYKYVDTVKTPFTSLPRSISSKLPWGSSQSPYLHDKEYSRINTLIKNQGEVDEVVEPLTTELAHNGAFSLVYPGTGARFEKWVIGVDECKSKLPKSKECLDNVNKERPSEAEIVTSINGLYYYAKNKAYSTPQYYAEMTRIESRRDFSRSVFLIACVYLIAALLLGLGRIGWLLRNSLARRDKRLRSRIIRVLSVWLILFSIYGLSLLAYQRESDEFNKRAFGYFSSMLFTEKLEKQQATKEKDKPTNPDQKQ